MILYIAIFLIIAILAVEYDVLPFNVNYALIVLFIILASLAGFRAPSVVRDYEEYLHIFNFIFELRSSSNQNAALPLFEPLFTEVVIFFRLIFPVSFALAIMLFFSICSVALKFISFKSLTINPFLAILFYYSLYFFLHEMTQIRFGLASGIVFIGLIYYFLGRKFIFILSIFIASLFHYSAILFLIILLFDGKFNKYIYGSVLLASIILGFFQAPLLNLLNNFNFILIAPKVSGYLEIVDEGHAQPINVFNTINLLNIIICSFFLILIPRKTIEEDKKFSVFLKSSIFSIFLLSFFASIPSMAFRVSEVFSIMFIFLYVYLNKFLPFGKINIVACIFLSFLIFYITVLHGDLVNPYELVKIGY